VHLNVRGLHACVSTPCTFHTHTHTHARVRARAHHTCSTSARAGADSDAPLSFRLHTWASPASAVGPEMPQPSAVAWDPTGRLLALAYPSQVGCQPRRLSALDHYWCLFSNYHVSRACTTTHALVRVRMRLHVHTQLNTHTHTHSHTRTHTHTRVCSLSLTHTHTRARAPSAHAPGAGAAVLHHPCAGCGGLSACAGRHGPAVGDAAAVRADTHARVRHVRVAAGRRAGVGRRRAGELACGLCGVSLWVGSVDWNGLNLIEVDTVAPGTLTPVLSPCARMECQPAAFPTLAATHTSLKTCSPSNATCCSPLARTPQSLPACLCAAAGGAAPR